MANGTEYVRDGVKMRFFNKFLEEYEHLKVLYPQLYLSINEFGERKLWRVSVFGKEMAIIGDAEFLTVEAEDSESAFEKAIQRMKEIPSQISDAIAMKESGRKIHVKRD